MSTVRIQIRRGLADDWTSVDPALAAGEIGLETDTNKFKFGTDGVATWSTLPYANVPASDLGNTLGDYVLLSSVGGQGGIAGLDTNKNVLVPGSSIIVEGATNNDFETTLTVVDPTADRTITFPNASGTVALTSDVTSAVSALIDAAPGSLDTLNEIAAALGDDANAYSVIMGRIDSTLTTLETDYMPIALVESDFLTKAVAASDYLTKTDAGTTYLLPATAASTYLAKADATADYLTKAAGTSEIGTAVSNHSSDTTDVHGISDTAALATKTYADTAVSTHSSDTTSVHGIADTSVLATTTDVSTAQTAAEDYADSQIDTHVAVTTNVHGIADTTKIVLKDAASTTLDGALIVTGDFTVNGTNFSASATSITIEDNLVQIAHQNAANTVDLGLVVGYNDGAAKHSGIVRDVSANKWKLFKGVTTEPSTTVDFTEGSLDDLELSNLTASGIVFTDGTQTKQGVPSLTPIIAKTDSYTLSSLTERDSLIEVSKSTATTITIPADASVNYPVGTTLDILQTSTGQVTIAGAGGVTVNATPGLKLRTQWSSATLLKRAADTWVVYGDLTA